MATKAFLEKAYLAYFGRPVDPTGLTDFANSTDTQVAEAFAASAESKALYGTTFNFAQINAIYLALFNREAEKAGLEYWYAKVADKTYTAAGAAIAILNGAQNADKTAIENKLAASAAFSAALDTPAEMIGYSGDAAAASARAFLSSVTTTAATAAAVDAAVASAVSSKTAVAGQTFTLTTSADSAPTSAANNTITGLISTSSTSTTFNATDTVIDTSTTDADVFTLTTEADVTSTNSGLVRGVETINVNANATTLTDTNLDFAATNFAGAKTFNFDVTKPSSAVSGLKITAMDINNVVVNASDDFSATSFAGIASKNVTINASAIGTSGTATTVTVTEAMGDVTATGLGHLSVTSNASTGLLSATAAKNLTLSGTAAKIISATATDGNVSITDATASLVTTVNAKGDVSILKLDAEGKLNVTAGGTITLDGAAGGLDTLSATLSGVGASTINAADKMTSLTLSGNGGKATYTMTAGSAELSDVNVTGASEVVLKLDASKVETTSAVLNVSDSGSGVFNLELSGSGNVNLSNSSSLVDKLTVTASIGNKTLSVKSGQEVSFKAAPATSGNTVAVGTSANATSNTVTLILNDEVKDGSAVAITDLTVTQAKNVTINASVESTAGGGAVEHTITKLTASAANSNVTVNAGANNISLAGTSTVGTGTLTFTGSGTITDTTADVTALAIDASAVTGKMTIDGTALKTSTIRTGTKDDILVTTQTDLDQTISTGAGDDTLTLQALDGTKIVSIDMGDGTNDRLKFNASGATKLTGTATLAGVETIEFTNQAHEVKASLLSNATYKYESAAAAAPTITVVVASTDTAVDLSKLVGSVANETAVSSLVFATSAASNSVAATITGAVGSKNSITGSSVSGDVLTGGTQADTFNYASSALLFTSNVMNDTIVGGSGTSSPTSTTQLVDAINFSGGVGDAVTVVALDSFAKASGIESITVKSQATTAAISLTLGATAQTAGITSVSLAGDTSATGANVVNVSAFTTAVTITGSAGVDTITGGAGNDVITGGAEADVLSGGAGDDNFVFGAVAEYSGATAIADTSIAGGDGTDSISVGSTGTALTITGDMTFTGITSVEKLVGRANTAAITITTDVTAYAAGIRTVDISAGTSASSNVINTSETVTSTHGLTLIGSATGSTAITGGSGSDTISGGSAADTFTGGAGNDAISLAAGGSDAVVFAASLTTNGVDTITGFQVGPTTLTGFDKLTLGRTNSGTPATLENAAAADFVSAPGLASNAIAITAEKVTEINLITTQTLSNATDGTELLLLIKEANGGTAATLTQNAATGADGHIIAYAGGNAYVYYYLNSADNGIIASEIALIGVITGVAPGGIEAGNIG